MTPDQSMRICLEECRLHAEVLDEALDEARQGPPFSADSVKHLNKDSLRLLDQIAYRFAKLQDTMGQKVLPAILVLAEEPVPLDATFAEKLNWLERIRAIPSANEWKELRIARNAVAHEYPDDPELKAKALNRFLEGALRLSSLHRAIRRYVAQRFPTCLTGSKPAG